MRIGKYKLRNKMPLSVLVLLILVAIAWSFFFNSVGEEPGGPSDNIPIDNSVAEDRDEAGDGASEAGTPEVTPEDDAAASVAPPPPPPPSDISKFSYGITAWHKYDR